MRIPLIAGNWKMNTTVSEAVMLVTEIITELDRGENVEKAVCPPYISLTSVKEVLAGTSVRLGAQDLYYMEKGAYTGEISPMMLAGICDYVIVGHSERRQYFGETDETVGKKVQAALNAGIKPIMCIGESLEENEAGKTEDIVTEQLKAALRDINYPAGFVIAYEPVWAIGTGRAATGEQANGTIGLIRSTISELYNGEAADDVRILYGGSVTAANTTEFMNQPEIDGALVGGASLKADEFISIIRQTADIR